MHASHLKALKDKHSKLDHDIHAEMSHACRNDILIEKLKKEKLHVKELIAEEARAAAS